MEFPGKSPGVGCHFLLQGIFPTLGSNLGLLHCRQTLYRLSHHRIVAYVCNLPSICPEKVLCKFVCEYIERVYMIKEIG